MTYTSGAGRFFQFILTLKRMRHRMKIMWTAEILNYGERCFYSYQNLSLAGYARACKPTMKMKKRFRLTIPYLYNILAWITVIRRNKHIKQRHTLQFVNFAQRLLEIPRLRRPSPRIWHVVVHGPRTNKLDKISQGLGASPLFSGDMSLVRRWWLSP